MLALRPALGVLLQHSVLGVDVKAECLDKPKIEVTKKPFLLRDRSSVLELWKAPEQEETDWSKSSML